MEWESYHLFTASVHLSELEDVQRRTGSLVSSERITEIEIEGFLREIIGAKDALLHEINGKLGLGLPVEEVNLDSVNERIALKGLPSSITSDLNTITVKGSWLWKLNEYLNHSIHGTLAPRFINAQVEVHGYKMYLEDPGNPNSGPSTLEVIPYFRDCLQRMSELVERTRSRLP